ncbi:hypothetical protein ACHAXA_003091 [Cyclostephanos tholiformis]|uniref:Fibrous sheath-interacting protein 1 n=1 Tax=Cyclostephanos tholiformis TaxID=382380 RepID=A0ABD3SRW6_9STRA
MSVIVEEDIFLTKQQNLHDEVCDGSNENDHVSLDNMKEALLEIEASDLQLEKFEFDCDQIIDFVRYQPDTGGSGGADAFPTPKLPKSVNIEDLFNKNIVGDDMGCSINAIERNKKLCSTANHLLTVEEEERIAAMMLQEHDCIEEYGFCISSTEKRREAELDNLLLGLGYDVEYVNDRVGGENNESEEEIKSERGDPILRELAKKRTASLREQRVDQALQKLLIEPLPRVVRIPKESVTECQDELSRSPDVCEEISITASISDDEICHLVQKLKKQFEDDGLVLADRESIRVLAQSIMDK